MNVWIGGWGVTKIVCHHSLCGYWLSDRCTAPGVEIDFEGVCLTQDEDFDELDDLPLMGGKLAEDPDEVEDEIDDEDDEDDEDSFDEWEDEDVEDDLDEEVDDDWTR